MHLLFKNNNSAEPHQAHSGLGAVGSTADFLHSCIYEGWVSHSRFRPTQHHFNYKLFMIYACLDELDAICAKSPFWSHKSRALARFCESDFGSSEQGGLAASIKNAVKTELGIDISGRIFLLANWRYWGYSMNPLSTFYCFDQEGNLQAVVAEVHNTPWGERHRYFIRAHAMSSTETTMEKTFSVSPFNPINMQYYWKSSLPSDDLSIEVNTSQDQQPVTGAKMVLRKKIISSKSLNALIIRYPFMTVKVICAIYWQALRLFLRGTPFLGKNKERVVGDVNK